MDITSAIMDQELGRSAFTVERLTYTRTAEGTTSRSVTHQAMGCVHPGTPEMIQLLPEEERHEEFIAIYTDFALSWERITGTRIPARTGCIGTGERGGVCGCGTGRCSGIIRRWR